MPRKTNTPTKKKATAPKKKATRKPRKKPVDKSYHGFEPSIWTPLGGSGYGSADVWGSQPAPTTLDLLNAYEDVVFACVKLISDSIGKHIDGVKLCVTSTATDARPRYAKQLPPATAKTIRQHYAKFTRRADDVAEVTAHPVLDLLDCPNPKHSFCSLMALADVYLELTGSAYLYKARNQFGIVRELWLLESQYVTPELDDNGVITGYTYKRGDTAHTYPPDDMIHFQFPDPVNPYGGTGRSPLRAVWQRAQLLRQEQASWQAILTNAANPSALIFPPAEQDGTGTFTPDQATRLSRQIAERFRMGNSGGPWVLQDRIDYQQLSPPPKDTAALSMYAQVKEAVCAGFQVPRSLLDSSYTTADADTAKRAFQEMCLQPRMDMMLDVLTHQLVKAETARASGMLGEDFSASRRLFLCVGEIVQPDRGYELQRQASIGSLVAGNIITQNEARHELGLPAVDGGNQFIHQITGTALGVSSLPGAMFGRSVTPRTKAVYRSAPPDPKPLAEALQRFFSKQAGSFFTDKATAEVTTKAFVGEDQWTEDMVRELTPILRAYLEQGGKAVLAQLGRDTDVPLLPVQQLDKAVERAVLALAASTHATTKYEVDEAVRQLREQLRQGLVQGEENQLIRERVQGIFTDLSDQRAYLIAQTESNRQKHAGELIAIRESGVEARKRWLPDGQACPTCRTAAARGAIPLDQPFHVDPKAGAYAVVDAPPHHPGCRCSLAYDL